MLLLAAFAFAQSPLWVESVLLPLPNPGLLEDISPADGRPDGWITQVESGGLQVSADPNAAGFARLSYEPGTKASLCSSAIAVTPGSTLRLTSRVRGAPNLGDISALHLHITGAAGPLHVAKRRFDVGDFPEQPVEILATVPAGGVGAYACFEVRMVNPDLAGALRIAPLKIEAISADSSAVRMPIKRVILVTVETFRRDHVGAYGYGRSTTPSLDAIIAEGVSFNRHYAPAPYTHPSLASLLTGQLPNAIGFADNTPTLPPAVPVLSELMAQAGYVTSAFNVQYVLSNRYGLNRGFHYYRNHPNDTPANVLNDEMLPFLSAHDDDNLFLWAHYFDPHGPYKPPARYRSLFTADPLYGGDSMVLKPGTQAEGAASIPKYIYENGKFDRRHYVANYDGDLRFTDDELGRLMDALRVSANNDTVLVITADHGESMTDHGRYFCHGSLYEHDIHVPMVVWAPGMKSGTQVNERTSHIDILPTLLDYAGVGELPGFVGQSLRPAIEGKPLMPRPFTVSMVGKGATLKYAVIADNGKKVVVDGNGTWLSGYDLSADPTESVEAKGSARVELRALAKDFRRWLKGKVVASPKAQTLDHEDEERLRALGYIE